MGDRLTEEQKPEQTSPHPYGDMLDECLPYYMSMGMSWDEYWDGEFGTKRAWRKAYNIRIEREQKLADHNNWLMGQYLVAALQAVPLLVAGFNVKRSTRLPEYPKKPFSEQYEEQKKEEDRKQKEEDQSKLAMALFQAMATRFNKNMEARDKPETK